MKQKIKIPSMEIEVDSSEDCEFVATGEYREVRADEYYLSGIGVCKWGLRCDSDDSYYFIFKKAQQHGEFPEVG
jgi:hypothetical protein